MHARAPAALRRLHSTHLFRAHQQRGAGVEAAFLGFLDVACIRAGGRSGWRSRPRREHVRARAASAASRAGCARRQACAMRRAGLPRLMPSASSLSSVWNCARQAGMTIGTAVQPAMGDPEAAARAWRDRQTRAPPPAPRRPPRAPPAQRRRHPPPAACRFVGGRRAASSSATSRPTETRRTPLPSLRCAAIAAIAFLMARPIPLTRPPLHRGCHRELPQTTLVPTDCRGRERNAE